MTNREVMQRYLTLAGSGDWDAAFELLSDDAVLHSPGRSSLAGDFRGKPALTAFLREARARAEGGRVEIELVDMLESRERVALVLVERFARPDGGMLEIRRTNVYRLRDGRIVEISIFEADQHAVDELLDGPA